MSRNREHQHNSPDCVTGKHRACRGDAWCFVDDMPALCSCECHDPKPSDSGSAS